MTQKLKCVQFLKVKERHTERNTVKANVIGGIVSTSVKRQCY